MKTWRGENSGHLALAWQQRTNALTLVSGAGERGDSHCFLETCEVGGFIWSFTPSVSACQGNKPLLGKYCCQNCTPSLCSAAHCTGSVTLPLVLTDIKLEAQGDLWQRVRTIVILRDGIWDASQSRAGEGGRWEVVAWWMSALDWSSPVTCELWHCQTLWQQSEYNSVVSRQQAGPSPHYQARL